MDYLISSSVHWYSVSNNEFIARIFFIQGTPFTFDELPEIAKNDPAIIEEANSNKRYNAEQMYLSAFYLIDEEAHPLLFELEISNPEALPQD